MAKRTTAAKKTSSTKPSPKKKAASPKKAAAKKATPRKTKASATKSSVKKASKTKEAVTDEEVTIDRRTPDPERRESAEKPSDKSETPQLERRKKVNRRRQIDPTTCERDYSDDEVEFMNALNEYKRSSGRMFPTCSEVLEVIRSLGYAKLSTVELAARNADAKEGSEEALESDVIGALEEAQEASAEVQVESLTHEENEEEAFIS